MTGPAIVMISLVLATGGLAVLGMTNWRNEHAKSAE